MQKGQSKLWHCFSSASPLGAVLTELFGLEASKDAKTPSGTHWGRTLSSLGVELKENMLQVLQGQIELAAAPDVVSASMIVNTVECMQILAMLLIR